MSTATLENKRAKTEEQASCTEPGSFCWNELMTSQKDAAEKFYSRLFGWRTEAFGGGGVPYTLLKMNGRQVGGIMARPNEQTPPQWLAYVNVENVDASTKRANELGAKICLAPKDIPSVGRIAVIQDPQGAALGLFQPEKR